MKRCLKSRGITAKPGMTKEMIAAALANTHSVTPDLLRLFAETLKAKEEAATRSAEGEEENDPALRCAICGRADGAADGRGEMGLSAKARLVQVQTLTLPSTGRPVSKCYACTWRCICGCSETTFCKSHRRGGKHYQREFVTLPMPDPGPLFRL